MVMGEELHPLCCDILPSVGHERLNTAEKLTAAHGSDRWKVTED